MISINIDKKMDRYRLNLDKLKRLMTEKIPWLCHDIFFPGFSRFSLAFWKKVLFSRFSSFSQTAENPAVITAVQSTSIYLNSIWNLVQMNTKRCIKKCDYKKLPNIVGKQIRTFAVIREKDVDRESRLIPLKIKVTLHSLRKPNRIKKNQKCFLKNGFFIYWLIYFTHVDSN